MEKQIREGSKAGKVHGRQCYWTACAGGCGSFVKVEDRHYGSAIRCFSCFAKAHGVMPHKSQDE